MNESGFNLAGLIQALNDSYHFRTMLESEVIRLRQREKDLMDQIQQPESNRLEAVS